MGKNKNTGRTKAIIFLLPLQILLFTTSTAADSGEFTIALHGTLGFDGGWEFDTQYHDQSTMPAHLFEGGGDYILTMGVGSFVDYGLTKNLALGLDIHFLWWQMSDRDSVFDRDGRLEIGPSVRLGFEAIESFYLYLRLSPGMTIVLYMDNPVQYKDTDIGYNIALFGGATYRFTENLGVMLEIGAIFHMFFGELPDYDYTQYGFQPHLNCGMFFSF